MIVNMFGYVSDMLNTLWHFLLLAFEKWYISLPITIVILMLPFIIRFVRAIVSRAIFCFELKSRIKKAGGSCKFLRFPIASLFINNNKNDAEITLNGQEYTIKFFPKNVRCRNVYLFNLEKAFVSRPTAQNVVGRWSGQFGGDFIVNKDEGEKRSFELKLSRSAENKNILLFQAAPHNIYVLNKNGYKIVGSGEIFEGVILYVGKEFLKSLDR